MYISAFSVVLFLVLIIWVFKRRGDLLHKQKENEYNNYLELEHQANFSRRKELDAGLFFEPDMSRYPVDVDCGNGGEALKLAKQRFVKQAGKRMVGHLGMSNRELKNTYGAEHFYDLAEYEENYTAFFHTGNAFAKSLIENRYVVEAKTLLNALISDKSGVSQTYILLAGILETEGSRAELDALHEKIDSLTPAVRGIINKALREKQ